MERYYFDVENGAVSRDERGTELPDHDKVRSAAIELLGQMLDDHSATFWKDPELRLTVRDHKDLILMRLTVFGTIAPAFS